MNRTRSTWNFNGNSFYRMIDGRGYSIVLCTDSTRFSFNGVIK